MKSESDFDAYFEKEYGPRWVRLKETLLASSRPVARVNTFLPTPFILDDKRYRWIPGLENTFESIDPLQAIEPPSRTEGLCPYYILDLGSVFAAQALSISATDTVADFCAAPGGKTLILIENHQKPQPSRSLFTANDRSATRRARLHRVLKDYLPPSIREKIQVRSHDASRWGKISPESCDRILLDVPCSSERHLLKQPTRLARQWSPRQIKRLASLQKRLLHSAFEALRPQGELVYSTCALSSIENEEVVESLKEKFSDQVEILDTSNAQGESKRFGVQILPDKDGRGPIYYAKLRKIN